MLKRDREAPDRLTATPHPGPTPRLNAERLKQPEGLLREGAKAHGWRPQSGTASRVPS
jgi:hypothetical protein